MIKLCILICLICAVIGFSIDKKVYSPIGIYSIWFFFLSFGANLLLFNLYQIDEIVYTYIAIAVMFFLIGGIIAKVNIYSIGRQKDIFNKNIFWIYLFIITVIYAPTLFRTIKVLFQGKSLTYIYSLTTLSQQGIKTEITKTGIEEVLDSYVLMPLMNLMIPLSIVLFFKEKKLNKLFIALWLLFIRLITSGTRSCILLFGEYIVLNIVFIYENRKVQIFLRQRPEYKKYIKLLILLAVPFVILISILTKQRGISNFVESLYYYYPGALGIFNQKLKQYNNLEITHSFGILSMMGFINPIVSFFQHLGIEPGNLFEKTLSLYHSLQNDPVYISDSWKGNVLVTNVYYFYVDGGIVGVIIGSIVYGYISENIYKKLNLKKSIKNMTLFSFFLCHILMMSHARMQISLMHIALSFVYMIPLFAVKIKYT